MEFTVISRRLSVYLGERRVAFSPSLLEELKNVFPQAFVGRISKTMRLKHLSEAPAIGEKEPWAMILPKQGGDMELLSYNERVDLNTTYRNSVLTLLRCSYIIPSKVMTYSISPEFYSKI